MPDFLKAADAESLVQKIQKCDSIAGLDAEISRAAETIRKDGESQASAETRLLAERPELYGAYDQRRDALMQADARRRGELD